MKNKMDEVKMTEFQFNELKSHLENVQTLKIRIMSDSMKPLFQAGDLLDIQPLPKKFEPIKFDVLTYWDGQRLIAHYFDHSELIFGQQEKQVWIFKPLVIGTEDFPVKPEHILGIVQIQFSLLLKLKLFFKAR